MLLWLVCLYLWDLDWCICHAVRGSISARAQIEIGTENFIYVNAQAEERARAARCHCVTRLDINLCECRIRRNGRFSYPQPLLFKPLLTPLKLKRLTFLALLSTSCTFSY